MNIRWSILSNTTVAPLQKPLKTGLAALGVTPEISVAQYGEAIQQILQKDSPVYAFQPQIISLYVDLEQLRPGLELTYAFEEPARQQAIPAELLSSVVSWLRALRANSTATILVNNFAVTPRTALGIGLDARYKQAIRALNLQLADEAAAITNCYVYDYDSLWAEAGWADRDRRFEMIAQLPFGPKIQQALIREWVRYFRALNGRTRKCVVVDLDNTLWGGILGEDGPDKLEMADTPKGRPFRLLQQSLKALSRRGVLLAISSKNNSPEALAVLRDHPEMILRENDFAAMQINWKDKATNISAIAKELNIGLQHMVFLDDNPAERKWVRDSLPEVLVPELPADTSQYADVLMHCELDALALTEEDRKRTQMYQADRLRRVAQSEAPSYDDFLKQLELTVLIEKLQPSGLERASQLSQRTNQFNLTTKRYTAEQLKAFTDSPHAAVLMMNVQDKFGEYGWTGMAIVTRDGARAVIDSFLVSCRVLGKNAEFALFAAVADWARAQGCTQLQGLYVATPKNGLCTEFYAKCGMTDNQVELAKLKSQPISHIHLSVKL